MRQKRKIDHLNLACILGDGPLASGFADIQFVPNSLPELSLAQVSTATTFLGRTFNAPLFINAISGGVREAIGLNRALARAARRLELPMALGSMTAALEDRSVLHTFSVAREENPDGFIAANVSAGIPAERALEAVKLMGADALQLHLNIPQEAAMPASEGDLSCKGFLDNIRAVVAASPVPVIVKEVGFGLAREQARLLLAAGVKALDTGGSGGTNFIRIENMRSSKGGAEPFYDWGMPSAASLSEVYEAVQQATAKNSNNSNVPAEIVATGGIRSGLDATKALALGAKMAGLAAPLLKAYYHGGEQAVYDCLLLIQQQIRKTMYMLGVEKPAALQKRPLVITGETGKWLELRGIDPGQFARR